MKFFKKIDDYTGLNENAQIALKYMQDKGYTSQDEMNQLETLKRLLAKHTNWIPTFAKFRFDEGIAFHRIESLIKELDEKRNLLNILPKPVIEYTEFEKLLDGMIQIERYQKAKKIIDKIPNSTLRRELLIPENLEKVKNVADEITKLSDTFLQTNFYKKVSAYKTAKDIIQALVQILKKESIPAIKKKAISTGSTIIYESVEKQVIVVQVFNYLACKKLGPKAWCIVREEDSFDEYYNFGFNRQFIIYDVSRPVVDTLSIVGVTVKPDGIIQAAHKRNDDETNIKELDANFPFLPWEDIILKPLSNEESDSILLNMIDNKKYTPAKLIEYIIKKGSEEFIKKKLLEYANKDMFWIVLMQLYDAINLRKLNPEFYINNNDIYKIIEFIFKNSKPDDSYGFSSFMNAVIIYGKKYYGDQIQELLKSIDLNDVLKAHDVESFVQDFQTYVFFGQYDDEIPNLVENGMKKIQYMYDCGLTKSSFWQKLKEILAPKNFSKGSFGADEKDILRSKVIGFCNEVIKKNQG